MDYQVFHPERLQADDAAAWRALQAAESAFDSPLLGPDFARFIGSLRRDARVIVARDSGKPLAFLPFLHRSNGYARPVGAPFSDYHGVVAAHETDLDIDAMLAAGSVRHFAFRGLIDPCARFGAAVFGTSEAYQINLDHRSPADHLEIARARSPKRFKNWRRLEHKLARDHGPLTLTAPDTDAAAFALMLGWKRDQLRRSGLQDVLRPEWVQAMMARLFRAEAEGLDGLMLTLRVNGRPVAAHFGVRSGTVFHPWIAAFDPAFTEYSVGNTHMMHAIAAMDRLGLQTYDLASGSDHYKHCYASGVRLVGQGTYRSGPVSSAQGLWEMAAGKPGTARATIIQRVQTRLDHIAASEITQFGRARGVWDAIGALTRRRIVETAGDNSR